MIESIKNTLFKAVHLGKGYPITICNRNFRIDESLRRFKSDSEVVIQKAIEQHVPKGGFFVDIGANFGLHTLLGCELVGATGRVIAVEPVPANLRLLRRNVDLNGYFDRCEIADLALNDGGCNNVEMSVEPGLSLAATLKSNRYSQKVQVKAGAYDQLISSKFPVPNLVKIDVEGAEHEVLKGATMLLKHGAPLLIEVHRYELGEFGSSSEQLSSYLASYGYREERLDEVASNLGYYHHSLFQAT